MLFYTLSLHDALPICTQPRPTVTPSAKCTSATRAVVSHPAISLPKKSWLSSTQYTQTNKSARSEEHTSELQSPCNLVCRLLLQTNKKHQAIPDTLTDK